MKPKKILITLLVLALAVTAGYFAWLNWKNSMQQKYEHDEVKKDDGIEYYHCAMHPWIKSDKPGKCPICGMDLTPAYKNRAQNEEGVVQIDPAMIQNIGVKTEVVVNRTLGQTIRTTGRVDYDETKQAYITIKFSGYIEKLFVDYTGKQVMKGSPLFEIYSPDLVAAQQEYLQAIRFKKNLSASNEVSSGADDLLQSAKRKLTLWDISSQQIKQIEETGQIKNSLTFYSPSSGYVVEKNIVEGMQVQAGMNLIKLADLSQMWVYADVYEDELSQIKTGDSAFVGLSYDPGKILRGKVSYIYPYVQDQTRTGKVRIDLLNPQLILKKDMYVTVNITPAVSKEILAVPEQAVIRSGIRDIVVLALGEGKYKSVEVQLGVLAGGYYEVKGGLNEGDTIVTSSQFLIDSESNLKTGMPSASSENESGKTNNPQNMNMNGAEQKGNMAKELTSKKMNDSESKPKKAIDPVCGMTVSTGAKLNYSYQGKTYYFCDAGEMEDFKKNPEKYLIKKQK